MENQLTPLRDVISEFGLDARKSLGQHFLLDMNITRKIVRGASVDANSRTLEIGPGPGALTRAILETGAKLIAVERDSRCVEALSELTETYKEQFTIVEGDALKVDERALTPSPVIILSNLPYNISTELLVRWLRANHSDNPPLWTGMALMFQKEVADRILANPGPKSYGRLSVIAQAASMPRRGFDLPARAFTPPPKVDSSVVYFEPTPTRLKEFVTLEKVTQAAFSQRRKMLRSSLKTILGSEVEEMLSRLSIPSTARAEEISVADFIRLSAEIDAAKA